jgi:hypothetical protein
MVGWGDHGWIIMFLVPHIHYVELKFWSTKWSRNSIRTNRFDAKTIQSKFFWTKSKYLTLLDALAERGSSVTSSRAQQNPVPKPMSDFEVGYVLVLCRLCVWCLYIAARINHEVQEKVKGTFFLGATWERTTGSMSWENVFKWNVRKNDWINVLRGSIVPCSFKEDATWLRKPSTKPGINI